MKSNIYDQFQFRDKLTTNSNLYTKIIKGTKNKLKDGGPKWNLPYIINFNSKA